MNTITRVPNEPSMSDSSDSDDLAYPPPRPIATPSDLRRRLELALLNEYAGEIMIYGPAPDNLDANRLVLEISAGADAVASTAAEDRAEPLCGSWRVPLGLAAALFLALVLG